MSDPNLILKDTGSVEQTNRLVCMYAETIFHHEQTLLHKSFILFAAHWSRDDALKNMILFLFSPVPLEMLKLCDSVSAT